MLAEGLDRSGAILDLEGNVLNAGAGVVFNEGVDLTRLEERLQGLVDWKLNARARVPHDDRFQARAARPLALV